MRCNTLCSTGSLDEMWVVFLFFFSTSCDVSLLIFFPWLFSNILKYPYVCMGKIFKTNLFSRSGEYALSCSWITYIN